MPTPTLTGGELTKSGVKPPSDYSKKKNFMIRPKSAKSVLFFFFCPKIANFQGQKRH